MNKIARFALGDDGKTMRVVVSLSWTKGVTSEEEIIELMFEATQHGLQRFLDGPHENYSEPVEKS